ncbi:transcription elongation factor GreA [Mucilaginibacter hurinus]|uniref:Transcription elongation factor GreA n=1 Tax=Mucilaginibacter hurinus TaxID=2201324 RepID=A0A367GK51_9SPHI|nr:GreA/GreB family elongation factor [Mucilaginibacter hurinus]RCH53700.1 transcription elongation factor GreA [Mucilaginibacter hurinus]
MKNAQLILSKIEHDMLVNHLKLSANLSEFNRKKLGIELKSARVLPEEELPADVVLLNSEVEIQDAESKRTFFFHLVDPKKADIQNNRLSIMSPIGVALLGYRPGVDVEWEMPNGLKTFKIVKVIRPVEAVAGEQRV